MKKGFLLLAVACMFLSVSCKKDADVTISFTTDNIVVALGGSNADLVQYAKASDGSTVTASGVDFEKIGEQTATFKAGDVSVDKTVRVSAARLAGTYRIHVLDSAGTQELTQGNGWRLELTAGDAYNKINIPSEVGGQRIFTDVDHLTVTFTNGVGKIANYTGGYKFVGGSGYTIKFQNITYGKNNEGLYALNGFTVKLVQQGYNDFYEQVRFEKEEDAEEEEE